MSEKVTWFYYEPGQGQTPAEAKEIQVPHWHEADDVAKAAHEKENVEGDFVSECVIVVSRDGKQWFHFECSAEPSVEYYAFEIKSDDDESSIEGEEDE